MTIRRRPVLAITLAAALLTAAGCSSSSNSSSSPGAGANDAVTTTAAPIPVGKAPVLLDKIRPAVAALEATLGGPQEYFEINATVTLVNLFVATDNGTKAVAYVYDADGTLEPPAAAQPASGPTFAAEAMTFDETRVMALTVSQLPTSTFLRFSVTGAPGGGVGYQITAASELGSEFQVTVGPTGNVLGTDELTPVGS
ncbi:MAG: hypothetical protein JWN62_1020 [Acidimicrobiales bacterium]|nr:hypothetical protein [Acidimicrobiales bacterium]